MVVLLAVWLPVPLKEVLGADLLLTVGAHKVLGVPRSAHGGNHLVWRQATLNKKGRLLHAERLGYNLMEDEVFLYLSQACVFIINNTAIPKLEVWK